MRLTVPPPDCLGTYAVSGNTVTFRQRQQCHGVVTARWTLSNGRLRLHVTRATDPGDEILFGGKPWKKIG